MGVRHNRTVDDPLVLEDRRGDEHPQGRTATDGIYRRRRGVGNPLAQQAHGFAGQGAPHFRERHQRTPQTGAGGRYHRALRIGHGDAGQGDDLRIVQQRL